MKRTSLLILCACLLLLAGVPMAMGATCNTAWVSTTAYNGGATVSYNGVNYTAAYWTQGNEPDTNNGPAGSGQPWVSNGSCSGGGGSTPTATKTATATNGCTATAITPYLQVGSGSWQQTTSATVSSGSSLNLGPQPASGGSWSWSGPNGYSSTSRQIAITVSSTSTYTATYTNSCGAKSTSTFTITVTGSSCTPTSITPYIEVGSGSWSQTTSATVSSGSSVSLGPQPSSGGSWSWSGPNGYSSSSRQITVTVNSTSTYTATYTNSCGSKSTSTFTITVSGSSKTPTPCQSNCSASGFIFAPYKDVTVGANWNTGEQMTNGVPVTQAMPNQTLVWAFATGTCGSETWAGISVAMEASNVALFTGAGKHYIIGTGGAAGSFDCPSSSGLVSFIQHYYSSNMVGVDFDIETGQSSGVISDLVNSAKGAESSYPNLRFSYTLASFGSTAANPILNSTGVAVVNQIKSSGLGGNYTVNPMAFDFGAANPTYCVVVGGVCEMGQSAIAAVEAVNQQFGIPYGHLEVTIEVPTDDGGASFTSADVSTLCSWLKSNGAAGIRYWSLDRDTSIASSIMSACGTN